MASNQALGYLNQLSPGALQNYLAATGGLGNQLAPAGYSRPSGAAQAAPMTVDTTGGVPQTGLPAWLTDLSARGIGNNFSPTQGAAQSPLTFTPRDIPAAVPVTPNNNAPATVENPVGLGNGSGGGGDGNYAPGNNYLAGTPAGVGGMFGGFMPTTTSLGLGPISKGLFGAATSLTGPIGAVVGGINTAGNIINTGMNYNALGQMGYTPTIGQTLSGGMGLNGMAGDVSQAMNSAMGTQDGRDNFSGVNNGPSTSDIAAANAANPTADFNAPSTPDTVSSSTASDPGTGNSGTGGGTGNSGTGGGTGGTGNGTGGGTGGTGNGTGGGTGGKGNGSGSAIDGPPGDKTDSSKSFDAATAADAAAQAAKDLADQAYKDSQVGQPAAPNMGTIEISMSKDNADGGGDNSGGQGGGDSGGGDHGGNNANDGSDPGGGNQGGGGGGNSKGGVITRNKLIAEPAEQPAKGDNGLTSIQTGEGVMTRAAMDHYGPAFLAALNKLTVPKMGARR